MMEGMRGQRTVVKPVYGAMSAWTAALTKNIAALISPSAIVTAQHLAMVALQTSRLVDYIKQYIEAVFTYEPNHL